MNYLFSALLAMGVTVALIKPLTAIAPRLGVIDVPGGRKAHARPIPRIGGIAMAVGMLLAMGLLAEWSKPMRGLLLGIAVLLPFGIQDDRVTLSPSVKLAGQLLAALCVMLAGDVQLSMVRHVDAVQLPHWIAWPLTMAFIVGVTNAINLADGLDGLAGGTTLLCLSGLLVLALTVGNMQVVFVCVVTMAALVGFLRYNTHPAHIFMGDAGSQLLGFVAAVLSLMLTQNPDQPLSPAVPLLLLGVPVIDTLAVMTERMLSGRSPFEADRTHVHHRLLAFGFAHHEAVIAIYGMQVLLLVLAWLLRFDSDLLIVPVFALVAGVIVTTLRAGRARQWRWRAARDTQKPWLSRLFQYLHSRDMTTRVTTWAGYVLGTMMVGYVLVVLLRVMRSGINASWDVRLLSAGAAMLLLAGWMARKKLVAAGWVERAMLYISAALAVMLDRQAEASGLAPSVSGLLEVMLFAIMLLMLLLRYYFNAARRVTLSPLDVLVVLLALVLPNLPGSMANPYFTTTTLFKALLLLYGIESLVQSATLPRQLVAGSALMFLAVVALRSAT